MLYSIEKSMNLVHDDDDRELHDVVRVTAQAVLLLISKYYSLRRIVSLMKDCELYVIAIGKWTISHFILPALTLSSHVPW